MLLETRTTREITGIGVSRLTNSAYNKVVVVYQDNGNSGYGIAIHITTILYTSMCEPLSRRAHY